MLFIPKGYLSWKGMLRRVASELNNATPADIRLKLRGALAAGELTAVTFSASGGRQEVGPSEWLSDDGEHSMKKGVVFRRSGGPKSPIVPVPLMVNESHLMDWIYPPQEGAEPSRPEGERREATVPAQVRNRGGAPAKYDWDSFWVELVVRADLDGLPEVRSELQRSMMDWCAKNWPNEPSESEVRKRLTMIYALKTSPR